MPIQLQLPIIDFSPVVNRMTEAPDRERGAVFTRREVVDFILDLAGYTTDRPLWQYRLLEPSFGGGDFLIPAVERLFGAVRRAGASHENRLRLLSKAIRAVEIHEASFQDTRATLLGILKRQSMTDSEAGLLLDTWLVNGDFLIVRHEGTFSHVVGNPPYVRQEMVPRQLLAEYKARYSTIYDRADLYVPFIECALSLLQPGGTLGFICSDRWMKNKYGKPLRKLVADGYHLVYHVDMVDTPAFHSEVSAYPAITVIRREPAGPTRTVKRPSIEKVGLTELAGKLVALSPPSDFRIRTVEAVLPSGQPWILDGEDGRLPLVRRLERDFPLLEEAGCRVGIGVATGADRAFIAPFDQLDVEPDRKLPLVGTRDIADGTVNWRGLGIVNPFDDHGRMVPLDDFPRLRGHFELWSDVLRRRNCAKKNPEHWYRTIDRIHNSLVRQPKLLVPDIKGEAHVVYEEGHYYPHHNLYYILSEEWDMEALQAVLMAGFATLFVAAYSTQMRGGYLRFQAQYLRRIRLPHWCKLPSELRRDLLLAVRRRDRMRCRELAFRAYGLSEEENSLMLGLSPSVEP